MRRPRKSLGGRRFGKLTVVYFVGWRGHLSLWRCWCECGNLKTILGTSLLGGKTKSCGCTSITHGLTRGGKPTEYKSWIHMKDRCFNPKCHAYGDYGGRGILVCKRWTDSFSAFIEDVGRKPSSKHSIDRINNNAGYTCGKCPECFAMGWTLNAKWSTRKQQSSNRRSCRILSYDGKNLTVTQWAEQKGCDPKKLFNRLYAGWPVDQILSVPIKMSH